MQSIGDFLKRYLNFTPPARVRSRAVCTALEELLAVPCKEDAVSIRGDIAFVRIDGLLKSEIVLHKTTLLQRIETLGGGKLSDLR